MAEDRLNEGQSSILCMSDISNKVINPLTWSRLCFQIRRGVGLWTEDERGVDKEGTGEWQARGARTAGGRW